MKLVIRRKFDAAHYLPKYPGKCSELHGHTWRVEVAVQGPVNPETGMVVDFVTLKDIVDAVLPDHKCINLALPDLLVPTAENLAAYFYERLGVALLLKKAGAELVEVKVWESDDAAAIYP